MENKEVSEDVQIALDKLSSELSSDKPILPLTLTDGQKGLVIKLSENGKTQKITFQSQKDAVDFVYCLGELQGGKGHDFVNKLYDHENNTSIDGMPSHTINHSVFDIIGTTEHITTVPMAVPNCSSHQAETISK